MASEQPTHDEVIRATAETEATMRPQSVPVNVYETTAALVVVAPMPAVTASDVCVELRPGTLRFWASLRSAGPRHYLVNEWMYGGYERQIALPEGYGGAVEANLSNGQLVIRVLRGETGEFVSIQPTAHG
ncbi:MAG: Hsp20/alpha crystallin family protein [Actinomycetota bacterium]|nr:Hsp20/alpha crystallin family protein [Actinomycetota bacterium]